MNGLTASVGAGTAPSIGTPEPAPAAPSAPPTVLPPVVLTEPAELPPTLLELPPTLLEPPIGITPAPAPPVVSALRGVELPQPTAHITLRKVVAPN